jgi:mono/diheme cytochrome c family protein
MRSISRSVEWVPVRLFDEYTMHTGRLSVFWSLFAISVGLNYCLAAATEEGDAREEAAQISFYRDVRPIFQARCHGCHQPARPGGEFVMTDFARLVRGGESGEPAIKPGTPETSYLVEQIQVEDGFALMPQEGDPLSEDQIALIVDWIRQGAHDDTPASARPSFDMEHPPTYTAPPVITSLDFSPDAKYLAISGYHEVVLHHADGGGLAARLVGLSERIESAVFSSDGKRLAVSGGSPGRMGEVQIWDVPAKELLLSVSVGFDTIYGASWSHDDKLVAFGCPDNTIRAIDAESGEEVLFSGAHEDWVLDTVFSVKSDHLVTVSRDMSMKLINVPTERFIDNITSITPGALKGGLHAVDRHPTKEEVVAGGADGVPKLYRMFREQARKIGDDYNLLRAFPALPGRVFDVAFSVDGEYLAAGSSYNNTGEVCVFKVNDGSEILRVQVASGGIYAVAFHPDGKTLAAGGRDGLVRLIDVGSAAIRKEFHPVELQPSTIAKSN